MTWPQQRATVCPTMPLPTPPANPGKPPVIPEIVQAVNKFSAQFKTFACQEVAIRTVYKGMTTRAQGELYYEPQQNFRLYVQSIMGPELDLGTNKTVFWFWAKRSKEPGLYYARYEDFRRTRLKTPLNPMWIKGSLGLDPIDTTDTQYAETEKDVICVQRGLNSVGDVILVYTFIDKASQRIRGFSLTDTEKRILASSEIAYNNGLPSKVAYSWFEEDRHMVIELKKPVVNAQLNPKLWEMPVLSPTIDMGKSCVYDWGYEN
jgi:hypothetical protein